MKNAYFLYAFVFLFLSCKSSAPEQVSDYLRLGGETMGTTYHVTYRDSLGREFLAPVDSLLIAFNQDVSTYIESSVISRFNRSAEPFDLGISLEEAQALPIPARGDRPAEHFAANYAASLSYYHLSGGAFDPSVMPLVNFWGFGYTAKRPVETVDSSQVDSLRLLVGMDSVLIYEGNFLKKKKPGVQLDFSAIAKGYGVDLVGVFLEDHGIRDYLVEIGGEVRARGVNEQGEAWRIGINTPTPEAGIDEIQMAVRLPDRALATSGNYRNFYEVEGRKYAHTINPKTGYPELNTLLSASVFAPTCTEADALATACMVMGLEKAFDFINSQENLEGYFIFGKDDGTMDVRYTSGLEEFLLKME
ncbi:MAG: FAD:protein FMN transferase [Lewinellaceae bacterium]|nr:FAD:protein FMN transferase [Lewinellaceae bacterium]